ncbi:MAG TPA: bifunctional diaminohydroxyphosphoribosylaminopyrimidine deaminase/5-amino-6-(5-phosphoribosylamino)uracil reductase RibD [Solirubrobacteraceae bacterium]|jgi:diaminohydroxyphosphoribosylaminopyrimidine deaminase/5-amino-6-(5-phosphoribosylamino)uracil reductase|nr:bifunctional diaminohydroxyphosphoribosylaminopyrimidine deaminase/5-amino-6-(5-phosphoribosylamino)uracil reductase RibD [Solirubrobacteraceae bacterium]
MTSTTDTDLGHLAHAIEIAARGRGTVAPNPMVGAVIAQGERVIGEGWHEQLGGAHAEVQAIMACRGSDLSDATLYVSLEPCCHTGHTPPCTEAILAAGIRRVVVACDDPTEKASGRGLGILRDEGVEVVLADGEMASSARLLNQPFRKHARAGRPWVLFKSAMTLDGKVATRAGDSQWISGPESRERAHAWRLALDAVIVGIGTVLADDPQLTARPQGAKASPERQPQRVVFDSLARMPIDSRLIAEAPGIPLTVVVSRAASRADTEALEAAGAHVVVAAGENEPARIRNALDQLGAMGITSALLEGGPHLAGAFLDAGEIDEIKLFLAPLLLGGRTARDPLEGEGVEKISDAMHALTLECERVGEDLMISARLREW